MQAKEEVKVKKSGTLNSEATGEFERGSTLLLSLHGCYTSCVAGSTQTNASKRSAQLNENRLKGKEADETSRKRLKE